MTISQPDTVTANHCSGYQLLTAMLEGAVPHPPICDVIPMRISVVNKGDVAFVVQADNRHLNPMGMVHGGFAATVLDTVTGCAIHTMLGVGESYGTVDLNVKMVRPMAKAIDLVATGTLINLSRSLAISEGVIKDQAGKLYAHATATCFIIRSSSNQ